MLNIQHDRQLIKRYGKFSCKRHPSTKRGAIYDVPRDWAGRVVSNEILQVFCRKRIKYPIVTEKRLGSTFVSLVGIVLWYKQILFTSAIKKVALLGNIIHRVALLLFLNQ